MRSDISLQNACRSLALLSPGYSYFPIANSCRFPLSATDDWNLASFRQVDNLKKNISHFAIFNTHADATWSFELKSVISIGISVEAAGPRRGAVSGAATQLGMGHSWENSRRNRLCLSTT